MVLTEMTAKQCFGSFARLVLARPHCYTFNHLMLHTALRGLGYNNWGDLRSTGERQLLRDIGPSLRVVFDVGANTGDYTAEVQSWSLNAKVYAFEPSARAYRRLQERFSQRL